MKDLLFVVIILFTIAIGAPKAIYHWRVTVAKAKIKESEYLAQAEINRAGGVAKANEVIGKSLQGNEAYLRYLWIQELNQSGHVIYVPTEANLPILEATRGSEK